MLLYDVIAVSVCLWRVAAAPVSERDSSGVIRAGEDGGGLQGY